jgi:hypothetical protein
MEQPMRAKRNADETPAFRASRRTRPTPGFFSRSRLQPARQGDDGDQHDEPVRRGTRRWQVLRPDVTSPMQIFVTRKPAEHVHPDLIGEHALCDDVADDLRLGEEVAIWASGDVDEGVEVKLELVDS